MPGLKQYIRNFICLCLIFVVIAPLMSLSALALDIIDVTDVMETPYITDGMYNIVNKKTGLYIDVVDIRYDAKGSGYLDKQSGQDGQDHVVTRQEDGSYLIIPQSEEGKYKLRVSAPGQNGKIQKSTAVDQSAVFNIEPQKNGFYTIHPAGAENVGFALSAGGRYGTELSVAAYDAGDSQLWTFVPVTPRAITLSASSTQGRVYDINTLTATVSPVLSWHRGYLFFQRRKRDSHRRKRRLLRHRGGNRLHNRHRGRRECHLQGHRFRRDRLHLVQPAQRRGRRLECPGAQHALFFRRRHQAPHR